MTKIHLYSYFILLLIGIGFLMNCKSDKSHVASDKMEKAQIAEAQIEKSDIPVSNVIEDNEEDTNSDMTEAKSEITVPESEVEKESATSNNKLKKPNQPKPIKTALTEKPVKVIPRKKAKIQFEELTWDFGEITEGDIIEKKFKFTNTGDTPLEIIATRATCGCTRPSFPFLDIAPGESHFIGVNYNSVGKDGEQSPEVTIESNTNPKITTLKLHGTVKPKPKKEKKQDSIVSIKDSTDLKQ